MRCEEARQYLYPFIDGQIDVERNVQVLAHLNVCPACGAMFESEKRLTELIREKGAPDKAPATLRERCLRALGREDRRRWTWRWASAAAILVGIALPVLYLTRPSAPPPSPPDLPHVPRMISDFVGIHKGVLAEDVAVLGAAPVRGDVEAIQAHFKQNLGMPACLHDLRALGYRTEFGAVCRVEQAQGGRGAWIMECRDEPGVRRRLLTQGALRVADAQRLFTGGDRFRVGTQEFRHYRQDGHDVLVTFHPWGSCVFVFQAEGPGDVLQIAQAIR